MREIRLSGLTRGRELPSLLYCKEKDALQLHFAADLAAVDLSGIRGCLNKIQAV
jgi:hypothetical protein